MTDPPAWLSPPSSTDGMQLVNYQTAAGLICSPMPWYKRAFLFVRHRLRSAWRGLTTGRTY